MTTLIKLIRERYTSPQWWRAVTFSALSLAFFVFGIRGASKLFLAKSGIAFKKFYATRRTKLVRRAKHWQGAHKYVVKTTRRCLERNADVFEDWLVRGKSIEQVIKRMRATDLGKAFDVVSVREEGGGIPPIHDELPSKNTVRVSLKMHIH